jgi:adenylate cyclase
LSAAIPFAYQLVTAANLIAFARTRQYRVFRGCEQALALMLPFALQLSLGGFLPSSGVILWSFTSPISALVMTGRKSAMRWFIAFLVVIVIAGVLDPYLVKKTDHIPAWVNITFFCLNIAAVTSTCYLLMRYFVHQRQLATDALAQERERSETLLRNVLPVSIAERLKAGSSVIADRTADAGVLFADLVGFTPLSAGMDPDELVELLDGIFSEFDALAEQHGLEKIKTIGDAYMVASGLLDHASSHAERLAEMALGMREIVRARPRLALRIGIDIGPVVAGVIGRRKFIYDLWGDTVNTASRMESHGVTDGIQVTERAYTRLREHYDFEDRGMLEVKGKGAMRAYLLTGRK